MAPVFIVQIGVWIAGIVIVRIHLPHQKRRIQKLQHDLTPQTSRSIGIRTARTIKKRESQSDGLEITASDDNTEDTREDKTIEESIERPDFVLSTTRLDTDGICTPRSPRSDKDQSDMDLENPVSRRLSGSKKVFLDARKERFKKNLT
eukprot:CAMPEP_0168530708 /NCGR_PEP_ID=MMETSP0405-20121227/14871_1 /TAXON_ID=498012 /ORGANISM="Trichosphaerium sp, Strain Am-I-7 wt" /LENGTH=147 /DNA_ID=CAMNT_0008555087 /DNA_START=229 /DNA_END=668 /DNA_ORIENTATION=-